MILYGSKYGSVREYVGWVQNTAAATRSATVSPEGSGGATVSSDGSASATGTTRAFDLKAEKREAKRALAEASASEPILILAPIYAGQIYGAVRSFAEDHVEELRQHPLALGLTSLYHGEKAREELMNSYSGALVAHASRQFLIGGRIRPAELPFLVRAIVKKITGTGDEIDSLDRELVAVIAGWLLKPEAS